MKNKSGKSSLDQSEVDPERPDYFQEWTEAMEEWYQKEMRYKWLQFYSITAARLMREDKKEDK